MPMRFSEILLEGLAPDGGLVIPDTYPELTSNELERWRGLSYCELAYEVLRKYIDDIAAVDLRILLERTYTAEIFGSEEITPIKTLEPGVHLLALSNGPTLAFKDIALQLLGNLFEYVLTRQREQLNILGATSGDTGSSAEYAMRGKKRIRVFMLSPQGRISAFQAAQMYSLNEPNIFNIAVNGVFDDCQDLVKTVSADRDFKDRYHLGTVNSINWARIAAQVVYYFKAYYAVTENNEQEVAFAVPTGNFGNVLAGHVARQMGLPVHRLIVATNENDVLAQFFRHGVYTIRMREHVIPTSSPSMDISKASNFERFMFDVVDRDSTELRKLWHELNSSRSIDVSKTAYFLKMHQLGFISGSSTHQDRLATIRDCYQRYGIIIDPHTADGVKVGLGHREPDIPLVCLETAQAAKFPDIVQAAIGRLPPRPERFTDLESLPQWVHNLEADPAELKAYIAQHCTDSN